MSSNEAPKRHPVWRIRTMRPDDIERCLEIWALVKLTESNVIVASYMELDPEAFHVAELEDSGLVVAMLSSIFTWPDTLFLGFYATDPAYQGLGIGRSLWIHAKTRRSTNLGLYAVPEMIEKYKEDGFVLEDKVRMLVLESGFKMLDERPFDLAELKSIDQIRGCQFVVLDESTSQETFEQLVEFDKQVYKYSREQILKTHKGDLQGDQLTVLVTRKQELASDKTTSLSPSCRQANEDECLSSSVTKSLVISEERGHDNYENIVVGYGSIRTDNRGGATMGPIYADSEDIAEALLKHLLQQGTKLRSLTKEGFLTIMLFNSKPRFVKIVERIGLTIVEDCPKLFTKYIPETSFEKVYALHSPNFNLC